MLPPDDAPPACLSAEEWLRYSRQIHPGVLTPEGQQQLKRATALVTRCGGMGGPAALCLAVAGIGRLILAHGGNLESPDLNRQILGCEAALGQPRAAAFAEYLRSMNRFVEVQTLDHEPDDTEADELARRVGVILSCPPTFQERLRLNRAAVRAGRPLVDAAQWGMSGTLMVVVPGQSACLDCVYPRLPDFEDDFPVVGAISSAIGSLAALEAIKLISGCGQPAAGKMLLIEGYGGAVQEVALRRRADCPTCGGQQQTAAD